MKRNLTTRKSPSLAILLCVCLSTACVSDPVTGQPKFTLVRWSASEELEIGRTSAPNIESQFDALYPDLGIQRDLGALVEEMVELSPRRDDFDFQFKVLDSSIPNALALPGGFVYITRGLLQELENEAQFIAVLGHELGHVEHQHSMLNQSQRSVLGFPFRPIYGVARRLPVGGRALEAATSVVAAPSALLGLSFSRGQELEADRRSVYFTGELGYDPREFANIFELFERLEQAGGGGSRYAIFRTHPLNKDRIELIEKTFAAQYPEKVDRPAADFRQDSPGFAQILEGFRDRRPAYAHYDRALSRLAGAAEEPVEEVLRKAREDLTRARELLPDEPLFALLSGELALAAEDAEAALTAFHEAHSIYERRTPGEGHWKAPFYLGAFALEEGNPGLASGYLRIAEERFPLNGIISLFLGRAYEEAGDEDAARAAYRRAERNLPEGSDLRKEARGRGRALS